MSKAETKKERAPFDEMEINRPPYLRKPRSVGVEGLQSMDHIKRLCPEPDGLVNYDVRREGEITSEEALKLGKVYRGLYPFLIEALSPKAVHFLGGVLATQVRTMSQMAGILTELESDGQPLRFNDRIKAALVQLEPMLTERVGGRSVNTRVGIFTQDNKDAPPSILFRRDMRDSGFLSTGYHATHRRDEMDLGEEYVRFRSELDRGGYNVGYQFAVPLRPQVETRARLETWGAVNNDYRNPVLTPEAYLDPVVGRAANRLSVRNGFDRGGVSLWVPDSLNDPEGLIYEFLSRIDGILTKALSYKEVNKNMKKLDVGALWHREPIEHPAFTA